MSVDRDLQVRLAVLAHVEQLQRLHGGVVPAAALNEGLVFEGTRIPIWNYQKGIFRPAILRDPGAALSIQTSFDSPYDDRLDGSSERLIYRYRGTDPSHPDNVALRRAFELRRPVLYLVGVEPGKYTPLFPCYVVGDRPNDLAFELLVDAARDIAASADADPLGNEPLKAYATRAVRQRLHQHRFRYLVLHAYKNACSMCHLRHPPLLDAAHILPDRDERGKPEVQNGLALCRIHHGAYDVGILGVDPDYRIHVRREILEEIDGPMLRHGLQELHHQLISVPAHRAKRPNRDYLAERFNRFVA